MDDEVTVCDTCGDAGRDRDNLLAICCKCPDGAQHTYCMRVKRETLPEDDWTCEECTVSVRSECQKSGSPVNLESWHSSNSKSKYSQARERQREGISSTSHSSAERHGVPSEAQPMKKDMVIRMSAGSSQPCYNDILHRDLSSNNFKNGKAKSTKDINSELRISCDSQEKAKAPHACGDKRRAGTLERENRDIVSIRALNLNAYPEDENDMAVVHENGELDSIDTRSSRDRILLGGASYNSGRSDLSKSLDVEEETSEPAPDFDLSLRPESATGNVSDKPNKDVKGKAPMEEKYNADNVELQGKLPMDRENNADNDEPSTPSSLLLVLPTIYEENMDPLHWQAAETLFLLSMGLTKI